MDKDNKYYNLIESLVKKHKKFPGYEAILDDIIDDVYSHSEVIINSVDNESVVQSYLEKVISTSIIVVPKKLNYNTRVSHRVISKTPIVSDPIPDSNSSKEENPALETHVELTENVSTPDNDIKTFNDNIVAEKANPKFVDQMINTMNSDLVEINSNNTEELEFAESESQIVSTVDEENVLEIPEVAETEENMEVAEEVGELSDNIETADSENFVEPLEEENETQLLSSEDVEEVDSLEPEILPEPDSDTILDNNATMLEEEVIEEPQIFEEAPVELSLEESSEEDNISTNLQEEGFSIDDESESENAILSEEVLSSQSEDINDDETISLDVVNEEESTELLVDASDENDAANDLAEFNIQDGSSDMELTEDIESDDIEEVSLAQEDNFAETELVEDSLKLDEADNSDLISEEDNSLNDTIVFDQDETLEISDELTELGTDNSLGDETILIDSDELESYDNEADDEIHLESSLEVEDDIELTQEDAHEKADNILQADEEESSLDMRIEQKKADIVHKSSDYSVFDYNPDEVHNFVDAKQITENLLRLNSEKPKSQVLKVFDLRYKQNYTLEQIASELNVTKDDVITVLNDIVELV